MQADSSASIRGAVLESFAVESPALAEQYRHVRDLTTELCAPLAVEDHVVQSMPDASPAKWHLAHTTWFFETFVLANAVPDYRPFHPQFSFLFNSYYNAVGERAARHERGLLSRPTVDEVYRYRAAIDEEMGRFLEGGRLTSAVQEIVVLGLNHEQQHQELLLTDVKHLFAATPLRPSYRERAAPSGTEPPALSWTRCHGGVQKIGHAGRVFAFDNESPRHSVFLEPYQLADRPVTNSEF